MIGVGIRAMAHYVPQGVLDNEQISTLVDTSDDWITKRTGISARHISTGENTSDLAVAVAQELLKNAGLDPADVDLILVATVTGDYLTPSVACLVQAAIGAENAAAFDINAACTGFVYGLSVAHKFLLSEQYKNILLIGSEVLSKFTDYDDRATCILFGDGAGGMVLSARPGGLYSEKLHARGDKEAINFGYQPVINPFAKGERNFDFIHVDGREVFDFAVKSVTKNIEELLAQTDMALEDIDYIIPHQANGRIIEAIAKKLKTDLSKFYTNIDRYGNTSSASIPIALSEMSEQGTLKPGKKIILAGFGGGLTWGCILLEI
jgi:3-oxoacyl-[acyl-carrier-protein] synthase-3